MLVVKQPEHAIWLLLTDSLYRTPENSFMLEQDTATSFLRKKVGFNQSGYIHDGFHTQQPPSRGFSHTKESISTIL